MNLFVSLFARLAVGAGFLSAVADRFGFWGMPGEKLVAWGNWRNFANYTSTLTFGATGSFLNILAILATAMELLFGIALIVGYKIKWAALFSALLLLSFALAMSVNSQLKSALDFSVFSAAACCLLLYLQPESKWSIDNLLQNK
jgi:putative oxidoreductase